MMRSVPALLIGFVGGMALHPVFLGERVNIGERAEPRTAAQAEIVGEDAGIAHIITGQPGSTVNEAFSMHAGYDASGTFRKMHSISTRWVDPVNRIAVTRYNSTYAGPTGAQTDDLAMQVYGGHGVAFFAPDSHPRLMPGKGVVWINGRVEVGPEGGKVDLLAKIAALEARLAELERR